MSAKSTGNKACYTWHSAEYKQESRKLAAEVGGYQGGEAIGFKRIPTLCLAQAIRTRSEPQ